MSVRPVTLSDVPACQAWLEYQAARGRFLYAFGRFSARFAREEPRAVRYRLQPLAGYEDEPSPEQRELYGESGWDYVADADGEFRVWRCDDPDAPELDTDPLVQGGAYDRFRRRLLWSNVMAILFFVGLPGLCLLYLFGPGDSPRLLRYIQTEQPAWKLFPLALMILFSFWLMIHRYRVIRRLVRTLKDGLPLPRRAPWRRLAAMGGVGLTVYLLWIASLVSNLVWLQSQKEFSIPADLTQPAPYVSLTRLDPDAGTKNGGFAVPVHNWMTEEQWWILESGQENGRSISCSTRYYRLRFRSLAGRLTADLRRQAETRGGALRALKDSRFDSAFFWGDLSAGSQVLLLRHGAQVIKVEYQGPVDLRDHLDTFQTVFDRSG